MLKTILTNRTIFILVLVIGIAIRIYGITIPAQPYDIATYQAWGNHLLSVGPESFFGSIWSDYLPLPILTFALPTLVAQLFKLDFGLVFKIFHTLIELVLILEVAKSFKVEHKRLIFLLLFGSSAIVGNNSFWGQVDVIPSLMAALSLVLMLNKPRVSIFPMILYGLSVAYKPIMLLIAPILWVVAIKKGKLWQFPLFSGITFFLTALPFVKYPFEVITFMWDRAIEQAGTYPYLSINAWNLWTITGNTSWIADNLTLLGISGHTLGIALFTFIFFLLTKFWKKQKFNLDFSYVLSAIILISFYSLTTRMHERHLLFGLPFLALSVLSNPKLFWQYLILTLCYTLNLYGAYSWVINNQSWPYPSWIIITISYAIIVTLVTLLLSILAPTIWQKIGRSIITSKTLVIILILASLLRFVNLSHPSAYIFDEVYHGFTAKEYLHNHVEAWEWWTKPPEGVAYEWTHPPVAKYGMVLGMLLLGEGELGYRTGSAVMGVLGILGMYLLVFSVTKKRELALLSAFLMTIEGTHLAQSRIAMNDSYMLTFYIYAVFYAVKSRWKLASILYGLALGSKWSAIYGLIPLMVVYLSINNPKYWNIRSFFGHFLNIVRYLLIVVSVYILTFTPFILAGHNWSQWWELQRQMWFYHTNLVATHAYQSTPLQWIFVARPVWYWVNYGDHVISNIYVQGNPLLLWFGLVSFILMLPKIKNFANFLFATLYLVFVAPWIFSPRIMFYYHYLPSSVFLLPILASWLNTLPKKAMSWIVFAFIISLLLISPMLYGFPLPETYWTSFFTIFPNWK